MTECDIIIPVWNQMEMTRECIDSILRNTDHPYRLILIDNGSDKATGDYLKSLERLKSPDVILIHNDENKGYIKAVNQGLAVSKAEYLCVMNNDTVVTKGWLSKMAGIMDRDRQMGILNPSSNTSGQFPRNHESIEDYATRRGGKRQKVQELYAARGFCMLIRGSIIEKLGPFDESYDFGYFEETDYSHRAHRLGYRIARSKASYIYHSGSRSFKALAGAAELFRKNEKIFYERWGRPVRVGYFINGEDGREKIDAIAQEVARHGHEMWVFLKEGRSWPIVTDHFGIRGGRLNKYLFTPMVFYEILKRKKKKALEIVLTDDRFIGGLLKIARFIHGSTVLADDRKEELMEAITERSKIF